MKTVLAHGCFDIVHPGHVRHLEWAKAQGDQLIVSITSDRFVRKGPAHPYFPADMRADQLRALRFVDAVLINDAPEPSGLIRMICPDVYVKGWEYRDKAEKMPELDALLAVGCRMMFSPPDVVYSSTALARTL